MRGVPTLLLLASLTAPTAAQVALVDLPALARGRAERLRPQLEQTMQEYWNDLALRYSDNVRHLEERFKAIVQHGDVIVPLLLEHLRPAANNGPTRNLAANCRRILARLDPDSFLDALVELVTIDHEVGRPEALRLLGLARSPRALQVLERALADGRPHERHVLLDAFAQQRATTVAPRLVDWLGTADTGLRAAVLDYLIAAGPTAVVPTVLQAMGTETEANLLPRYVEYFARAATANAEVATALLGLLGPGRLDWMDSKRLVEVLATIAPRDHDPTQKRLHDILDSGDTEALGLQAALTLRALGDKTGLKKLQNTLNERIKRARPRQKSTYHEQRGDMYFAIGEYKLAAEDYEEVLDSSQSSMLARQTRKQLARCEARRGKWSSTLDYLQAIEPVYEEVMEMAAKDPAIEEALQQRKIRRWLDGLPHREK